MHRRAGRAVVDVNLVVEVVCEPHKDELGQVAEDCRSERSVVNVAVAQSHLKSVQRDTLAGVAVLTSKRGLPLAAGE